MEQSLENRMPSRHKRPQKEESRERFMVRQLLNLIFILGVIALIVLFFVKPGIQNETGYIIFGMLIVLLKIAEMIIRFLPK